MRKLKHASSIIGAIVLLLLISGCSTQKSDWMHVQYHNITTHYNIWWNGNESLKLGVRNLQKNTKEDYTQILPVYKLGTKEDALGVSPQMDRAIEKGVKGIKKHSIFLNGKEHVPYISNCYFLTAYATFYKKDFVTTNNTCQMLAMQYAGTEVADEANILLARCAAQEKQYNDAESALDELVVADGKGNFAKSQRLNLYLAMAECTLPQEKYKKAVQYLKLALDENPTQEQSARINYILGQVYQSLEKRPTATKYYENVLRKGPDYEMEFNTRLNIASCADLEHTNLAKLEKLLDDMLKDGKNDEYHDQIYYAKGEMYMGVKETKKAIENFRKSVAVSTTNTAQKAKSSLRLGDIYYDLRQDYDQAQYYYDTAMALIKSDYPHYSEIKSRYDLLTSLVSFTRTIDRNDSLIRVADMPEKKRIQHIQGIIEEVIRLEKEAKERELLEQFSNDAKAQQNTLKGDWYFYNANTVQKGKETFKQRWGMRALEDYWFLSKRGTLGMSLLGGDEDAESDEANSEDSSESLESGSTEEGRTQKGKGKKGEVELGDPNDNHAIAYYLKTLPQTQEDRDSMSRETALNLLNAGYIYYDGIHNIPRALECYLRMAENYTENDEIVQAFFMLYKVYDRQGNTPSANYYRDMVLMGFPDSDYANMILDEDYYKEILRRSQLINEDYERLYTAYRKRRYDQVINIANEALANYNDSSMLPKFSYWQGLAYAHTDNKPQAIATFEGIINSYPATDSIVPLAQAQLDYLRGEGGNYVGSSGELVADNDTVVTSLKPETLAKVTKEEAKAGLEQDLSAEAQLFRFRDNQPHFVVIIVKEKKIRATELQMRISDFNSTYYANFSFTVKPLMFTDSTQMITISTFNTVEESMNYYRHLFRPESPLSRYDAEDYQIFAISKQNYTTFYNRKKLDAYASFFDRYYLNPTTLQKR